MKRFPRLAGSLTVRIPLLLLGVQAGCIVLGLMAFPLLAPFTTYGAVADTTVRGLLLGSLTRASDGLHIVPSPALLHYASSRPALSYAVMAAGQTPAAGSMADMAALLIHLNPNVPLPDGNLEVQRPGALGGSAFVTTDNTAFGTLTYATAGNVFRAEDLPTLAAFFLPAIPPAYGPMIVGAIVILPLMLRRMLRPLRAVAQAAASIDLRALDQRLPTEALPSELRPAVTAINTALDRVSEGWSRQKLFTANAAHELRTPVAVLQARIDGMDFTSPDRAALARDARRLRLLVDQLLAVARLDHRDAAMDSPVDLVATVRAMVADCAPLALRNGRAVAFHSDAPCVTILGDQRSIEGAVANLIDNALRAEPRGGTVDVAVYLEDEGIIEVRDHGAGIVPADRALVFEPFWRKDESTTGTGLGLATVREVVQMHGGSVNIDDTPGGGATFRLTLPCVRPAQ